MVTLNSVLVVGPTGSVGLALCKRLIEQLPSFKRIAAFNNTERPAGPAKQAILDELHQSGMEIVSGTYNDVSAFRGFEVVMMPLGNSGNFLQPQIIDTAIKAGIRHFYPSEFGGDITVGDNWNQRYYRDKVLTREYLQKCNSELRQHGDGIGWSLVCIGRFMEWSITPYFGWDHINHTAEIYGDENGRQSLIALDELVYHQDLIFKIQTNVHDSVAAFTVLTLLDPFDVEDSRSCQRTYRFAQSSPTWKELFGIMEKVTGHPYRVTYRPVSEAQELQRRAKEMGDEKLESAASHRLVQGTEGTLLPQPWDNSKFPEISKIRGVEEVLKEAFHSEKYKSFYGL